MKNNIFETINLWGFGMFHFPSVYYIIDLENQLKHTEDPEEVKWLEKEIQEEKENCQWYNILIDYEDKKDFIEEYIYRLCMETWKDYSYLRPVLHEVLAMKEVYLELRNHEKGKGSRGRKDQLAIQYFRYAFSYIGLDPREKVDCMFMESFTGLSLETGMPIKERRDKKIKWHTRERFYLAKPKRR